MKNYFGKSFVSAFLTFVYVFLVALFIFNANSIFGRVNSFLAPVLMLLLFIVSALITGTLVLKKPIELYLNGAKKEAFALLFETLGWLVVFLIAVVIILLTK